MKVSFVLAAGVCLFGALCIPQVEAASITTVALGTLSGPIASSGTLPNQAQVLEETFSLTSTSALTAFTTSYATGGFEPMLSLFNSAGMFIAGEDVTSPTATVDPTTGLALDAYLKDSSLAAGSYILVLTDWLNQQPPTATNLSSGFTDLGSGTSTFVDEQFNSRTAAYTLDISATAVVAAPEPATSLLVIVPLFCAILVFKRRSATVK